MRPVPAPESMAAEARRRGVTYYRVRVDRAQAIARAAGKPIPTARAAAGHRAPRRMSGIFRDHGYAVVEVSYRAAKKLSRYDHLASALLSGHFVRGTPITPEAFARAVRAIGPVQVLGGDLIHGIYELEDDPDVVLATLYGRSEADLSVFEYEG